MTLSTCNLLSQKQLPLVIISGQTARADETGRGFNLTDSSIQQQN